MGENAKKRKRLAVDLDDLDQEIRARARRHDRSASDEVRHLARKGLESERIKSEPEKR